MIGIIHLRQGADKHRLSTHGLPDFALEFAAEQLGARLINEPIGLAFDLDNVGVFRYRPEWTIAVGLRPMNRILAPQLGKHSVLCLDASVGLVIGNCIVQRTVEHWPSLPCVW
jgi:hypothetical protein